MEVRPDHLHLLLLQKDVEMELLELSGSNSKILYIYQMEMLQHLNTQHYSPKTDNNTKMRIQ